MNVCTVIAKNYLAHARVLGRSLREHNPGARLWTLVIDDYEHFFDPALEPFEVLTPADIGCDQFMDMALRYSVLELSTAVKPWLLRHLMNQTGGPVTYLDPDIKVFGSLHRLDELGAEHGLVLTPHNSRPIPHDGRRPSQVDIMIAGVYNLGYVTLAPRPEIDALIDWWADRLLRDCRVDPQWGYFVDQRWFDLAPGLVSELAILRDPQYNVAYWNLHSRVLRREQHGYTVDGRPLAFFHFSGFDPATPRVLSRHQDRVDVLGEPALEQILAEYAADVNDEGHAVSRRWPYTYGALGDRTPLDATMRTLLDVFCEERRRQQAALTSPFSLEGAGVFDAWLRGQAPGAMPGISRALAGVYESRQDLQAAYPDLNGSGGVGLLRWADVFGRREVPVLAHVMSDGHGLVATSEPEPGPEAPGAADRSPQPPSERFGDSPWGVNVIGQFGDRPQEPAEAAHAVVRALDARGIPSLPVASDAMAAGRDGGSYLTASPADAPFATNLLALDGDRVAGFVREAGRRAVAGRYSIGLWFWPVDRLPDSWRAAFSLLEEVWVPSAHVADAVTPGCPVPVTAIPIPVEPAVLPPRSRTDLGLPEDCFLFLTRVDCAGSWRRQNPAAVLEAFAAASASGRAQAAGGARLVVRCANADSAPDAHAQLVAAAQREGVIVIDRHLSPEDEHSLISLCDCLVSLHRAESFGWAMAHAMARGRPVIATGYSGNLDYMTPSNSLLVDHALVDVGPGAAPYPAAARWAEPDVEHAAACLRRVLEDPAAARALGETAAQDIRRTHSVAAAGEAMARRLEAIRHTGRVRVAAGEVGDVPAAVAQLPREVHSPPPPVLPGRAQGVRALARSAVLRLARPVMVHQRRINEGVLSALMELHRGIADLRREDAEKRANLLSQLRAYQRLMPLADEEVSGVGEIKRLLTLQTDRAVYLALAELRRRHAQVGRGPGEAPENRSLTEFELRVFSQNGEDGVLAEILRRVGAPGRFFVEFGVESGREGNCVYLADVAGWRGLFMDGDDRFYADLERKYRAAVNVTTAQAIVTPANVQKLFSRAGVPEEPDVLSIDVDGQDYWIWEAIDGYRPRVVVIEYNSALDPRRRLVQPNDTERSWAGTEHFGASLGALVALGERKGYRLVHTELSGANAFFVRADLAGDTFPPADDVARRGLPNYFQSGYRHPPAAPAEDVYLDLDSGSRVYGGSSS